MRPNPSITAQSPATALSPLQKAKKTLLFTGLSLAFFSLSACGIFGGSEKEFVFDSVVGPDTKAQLRSLPKGIEGDEANQRHLPSTPPDDMAPSSTN